MISVKLKLKSRLGLEQEENIGRMMWDFGNRSPSRQDLPRSRSRSPQPPSFPVPQATSSSNPYGYSSSTSSSYPPTGYTQYTTRDMPIPSPSHLSPQPSPTSGQYPSNTQVIHVIHHSTHHSKHKHKHKSKDKEREKEKEKEMKKSRSKSHEREVYTSHQHRHGLSHSYSNSNLNVSPQHASYSFPSPTRLSPTSPHYQQHQHQHHHTGHSPTHAAHGQHQPQTSRHHHSHSQPYIQYTYSAPPPLHQSSSFNNLLHKPRPSTSGGGGRLSPQPLYPSQSLPSVPVVHEYTPQHLTVPPKHGILKPSRSHGVLQPSPHQIPEPLNPMFQYSKCTGRKRALCIGINYTNQSNALRGCVNDARHVRDFLVTHGGYRASDVLLLTDEPPKGAKDGHGWDHRTSMPTRENMIRAMRWLVRGARRDDSLFFHYSGHGGQTEDLDGDEVDGWDEVIYPVDFKTAGPIVDDEMHEIMVRHLPQGCRLTGLFDACHSGTVLDLPYIYSSHGRLRGSHISDRARQKKATPADVISWSGCKDGQTSADTFAGGVAVGAMSYAFITSLSQNPNQTYQEFLRSLRMILHPKFSQKPQLGSSHHIDTNLKFVF